VQAYGERSPDRPLLTKSGDSTQWTTMRAMWDAQPTATLLVLLDAKGTPVHVREIGAVLKIEEVALFAGEPTFFVQRLGSRSGVDDEIPLDVWVLHDDDLVRLASYPLGMRDVSPCGDGGSCALGPPGSVTIAGRTPPRLRIRIDDAHHTPADVEAGFMGIEREETWDESKRAFVSGPSHPVRLKGVRRPL
jgi:hypothetical protein